MTDLLTPELLAAFFALLQNPTTAVYCWILLFIAGLWVLSKLCTALTALVKAVCAAITTLVKVFRSSKPSK